MKDKILILGNGYIGNRIQEEFQCDISARKIYSFQEADEEIAKYNPSIIINCIGHTGRNVDDCEQDKDRTLTAQTFIPILLKEVALRRKIRLVHISSGCIYHFDYTKDSPITEDTIPDYFDLFYSRTKIYAERALEVLSHQFPVLIVRIRIPLDNRPHPRNLLTKLINYKRVIDLPNSVTYMPDFIHTIKHLIQIKASGIYNVVNSGGLAYPALLEVYKNFIPDFSYEIVDYKKLNLVRTNLILSTKKLEDSGFKVRDIHDTLEECVRGYLSFRSAPVAKK